MRKRSSRTWTEFHRGSTYAEDIVVDTITSEYDFVRVVFYTERDFGLETIRTATCNAIKN